MPTTEQIEILAHRLATLGVESIKLSGGEPTVRKDLPEIVRIFGRSGFRVTLTTNGILMKASVIDALKEWNAKVKFSIHYPDARNDIVIGIESFQTILSNAALVVNNGIDFSINTVVDRRNQYLLQDLITFAIDIRCRKISFIPLVFRGAARRNLDSNDMNETLLTEVVTRIHVLRSSNTNIDVRMIDLRRGRYWVIDHDGRLFISGAREEDDVYVTHW